MGRSRFHTLRGCEEEKTASWEGRALQNLKEERIYVQVPWKRNWWWRQAYRARKEQWLGTPEGSNCGPYSRTPQSRQESRLERQTEPDWASQDEWHTMALAHQWEQSISPDTAQICLHVLKLSPMLSHCCAYQSFTLVSHIGWSQVDSYSINATVISHHLPRTLTPRLN